MKISFVIPCYNSENTLPKVVNEIISTIHPQDDYEIIMVSDSSPDNVYKVIEDLCHKNIKCKGLELTKNFGQHSALLAGYSYCTGDIIISTDDDGQTPIDEVYSLIDKLQEGYDVVYGVYEQKQHNAFRNIGSKINDYMIRWLLGKSKDIYVTSYFAVKPYIITEILRYKNAYPYIIGLIFRSTNKISNVTVTHRKRLEGKSGYDIKKLISLWLNGFTAFSVKPLRIATHIGGFLSLCGFLGGIYIIIKRLCGVYQIMGYASIMTALLFIGGLLMAMIGLIGEYIGRIYICINNSPQYVVKCSVNIE